MYLKNGKLHNEGEPAWIHADGTIEYYTDGKLDNKNGPARILNNGLIKEYWFNGVYGGREVDGVFYSWSLE